MSWSSAAAFYNQLGVMLRAGLTIPQAIEHAGRSASGFHAQHAAAWSSGCAAGRSFAEQLAADGEEPIARALTMAGEQSGHLPEMVQQIAAFNEHRMELRRMIIGRLIYPLLLINVALLMPGVVKWFVKDRSMIGVFLPLILFWGFVVAAAVALYITRHSGLGARLALLPLVRTITGPLVAANTCLVLHATTTAGMLHHRGLELAADGCGNRAMAARLRHAATELMTGRIPTFTAACATCDLPRTMLQLIEAGEVSGSLEVNLGRAAALARESFKERTMWAARIFTGLIYTIAIVLAAYTAVSMYGGMMSETMKMAEDI
jgi:type II secretory pathway component PulF